MLCIIHAKHDSEDKQTGYWQFGCSSCMRNKIAALRGECEKQRLLLNEAVVKLADCYEDYKKYRKASEEKDTRIAELKAALEAADAMGIAVNDWLEEKVRRENYKMEVGNTPPVDFLERAKVLNAELSRTYADWVIAAAALKGDADDEG